MDDNDTLNNPIFKSNVDVDSPARADRVGAGTKHFIEEYEGFIEAFECMDKLATLWDPDDTPHWQLIHGPKGWQVEVKGLHDTEVGDQEWFDEPETALRAGIDLLFNETKNIHKHLVERIAQDQRHADEVKITLEQMRKA